MLGWLFGRRAPRIPLPPRKITQTVRLTRAGAFFQLEQQYGQGVRGDLHDTLYAGLDGDCAEALAGWLGEVQASLEFAGFGYKSSVSDCDDIAAMAMAVRRLLPLEYTPLAVRQSVRLPDGGLHMDVAFFLANGWVVIEPQTGEWWWPKEYPHEVRWVFVQ